MDLESTHWGRYGDNENMRMYAWPLIWTNSWTGKCKHSHSFCHVTRAAKQDPFVLTETRI